MTTSTSAMRLEAAVWQHPLVSKRGMLERLFTFWFNSFVYNQIWEDPRVDLAALKRRARAKAGLVTISSGGCNVLNYLVERPAAIAALDMNRSHINLLRLKLAALEHLPGYDAFFLFFGCGDDAANRRNYYRHLSDHLDEQTREFWEGGSWWRQMFWGRRINYFTKNFYDYAKLGYFLRFVHRIARAQHCNLGRILTATTAEEQETFYREDIKPAFDHWIFPCRRPSAGRALQPRHPAATVSRHARRRRAGRRHDRALARAGPIVWRVTRPSRTTTSAGKPSAGNTTAPQDAPCLNTCGARTSMRCARTWGA